MDYGPSSPTPSHLFLDYTANSLSTRHSAPSSLSPAGLGPSPLIFYASQIAQDESSCIGEMKKKALSLLTPCIALAMAFGLLAGAYLGTAAAPLGVVGKIYIQLIKAVAIPLVLFSIIDALIGTELSWKTASRWVLVIVVNSVVALSIGLLLSNVFTPGIGFIADGLAPASEGIKTLKQFSVASFLQGIIPESLVQPFAENNVLSVVLIALLIGLAMRQVLLESGGEAALHGAAKSCHTITAVINRIMLWLVAAVPVAIFCVTARTVGEYGFAPFKALAWYVFLGCLGMMLQMVLVYPVWVRWVGQIPLRKFFYLARRPVACAFGTNSSLATLPVTLHTLDELGIPKSASRLGACIGTNFNNDGILLYEAMAVLFVAQACGIQLTLGEQAFAALLSLVAAIGVAGVPEAGVVSLSLVLSALGLPLEILPLLLTVDWIVARVRSVTNVMSDMTVSIAVAGLTPGAPPSTTPHKAPGIHH